MLDTNEGYVNPIVISIDVKKVTSLKLLPFFWALNQRTKK